MKDETFNGSAHAEEIFFKSAFSEEETLEKIKSKISYHCGTLTDNSIDRYNLKFTKQRLFWFGSNVHCDIQKYDNKYLLKLYYTIEDITWACIVFVILLIAFLGTTKILNPLLDSTSETTSGLIVIGIILIVIRLVYVFLHTDPKEDAYSLCKLLKREMEGYAKLELES